MVLGSFSKPKLLGGIWNFFKIRYNKEQVVKRESRIIQLPILYCLLPVRILPNFSNKEKRDFTK